MMTRTEDRSMVNIMSSLAVQRKNKGLFKNHLLSPGFVPGTGRVISGRPRVDHFTVASMSFPHEDVMLFQSFSDS